MEVGGESGRRGLVLPGRLLPPSVHKECLFLLAKSNLVRAGAEDPRVRQFSWQCRSRREEEGRETPEYRRCTLKPLPTAPPAGERLPQPEVIKMGEARLRQSFSNYKVCMNHLEDLIKCRL